MVIDTSALLAILLNEPERPSFIDAMEAADARHLSVASFVEASMVIEGRHGAEGIRDLDRFLQYADVELAPVNQEQGKLAREAFRRFGKGRHPARLNFGDCFGYALATARGEALLFKGDDFSLTDVVRAIAPPSNERAN